MVRGFYYFHHLVFPVLFQNFFLGLQRDLIEVFFVKLELNFFDW